MNVSDVIKIIQRIFNCTIIRRLVSTKSVNRTPRDEGDSGNPNEMTYCVKYHSSIYGNACNGVVWWSYLPTGHIKYLHDNLELISFRNSATTIDMYDFILFTWGTVEKYYMGLHSTLVLAFEFIHKIFSKLGDSYAGTAPRYSYCFLISSLLKGKPVFSMFDESWNSDINSKETLVDLNGNCGDTKVKEYSAPLTPMNIYTEIMGDDAVPMSKTLWLKVCYPYDQCS